MDPVDRQMTSSKLEKFKNSEYYDSAANITLPVGEQRGWVHPSPHWDESGMLRESWIL